VERTPIIRSKLAFPSLRGQLVERARLDRRLADLISRFPVVCVVATAGAGKTTAVVQTIRHLDRPVAWLAVDSSETSAGRLLTYLEATLALRVPAADGVATRALGAGVQPRRRPGCWPRRSVTTRCCSCSTTSNASPASPTPSA
jgi:ATP/maltotriose-dependent transcriptional regulator MalT